MLWIGDGKPVGGWGVWWAGEAVWLILCSIGWWEGVEGNKYAVLDACW